MRLSPKALLPLVVLALGSVGTVGIIAARPSHPTSQPAHRLPLVRVMTVESRVVDLHIEAQGSVVPRTESELVAEVSGRIIRASPQLASGGFVESGDVLVEIDPSDYEIAAERDEAALARAESQLALARSALVRQRRLATRSVSSSAELDNAVSRERVAEANQREAKAALAHARRDLERTKVTSPFAGRVRKKYVDVGQFVARGSPVARIYAVDFAEVRLPIPDRDAAFVDLPIDYRDEKSRAEGPAVVLRASFAGRSYSWEGRIVRTEGELDPKTRMIHAVARVEDPYGRGDDPNRPPLAVGLFVNAEIRGRRVDDAVVIPRSALRGHSEVVVVDDENRLRLRRVDVLRRNPRTVVLSAGIEPGERVCTAPLSVVVDGMQVRPVDDPVAVASVAVEGPVVEPAPAEGREVGDAVSNAESEAAEAARQVQWGAGAGSRS
jgi:RND family efflux transporter MFP subunit